jgi:hypothetical protein
MKKLLSIQALSVMMILTLQAQPVSDYLYKLDNGITIKTDRTWSQVWVQQSYAPLSANDQNSVAVNVRTLGDLIASQSFVLMSKGKEVKTKGIAPGSYDLKMTFKLSGKPGTLSFVVGNVLIKPNTKTNVGITLYDYQITIDESMTATSGLSSFETSVHRCKSSGVEVNLQGIPSFYSPGNRTAPVTPDEGSGKTKGRIKAGTYDVLMTIGLSGQSHKVWLENFQMKPGTSYRISTNLNAGGIIYTGGNKNVKSMHLYPAGTAARQTGMPAPVKNQETISYTNIMDINCCTPGTFDVLLRTGDKYEWRTNIAVTTGTKTEVR